MKLGIRLLAIFALTALVDGKVYSQPYPVIGSGGSQVTPGGVWSKNMELICPLSLPTNSQEMFQFSQIKYGSSLGSTGFYIITTDEADGSDPSEIRLIDVTLPRSLNSTALKISVSGGTCRDIEVWTDNSTGNTFSGHTFAVVYVDNVEVFHDEQEPDNNIYAAYLIFNLSDALTCGATTLTVGDPKEREVSGTGLDATYEKSVYIGYIRKDKTFLIDQNGISYGPHTTNIERELGIFMNNGGRGYEIHPNVTGPKTYIDLYDLAIIAPNTTDANRTSSTLIEIPRLGTAVGSGATAAIEPVVLTMPTTPTDFTHLIPGPHEVSGEKVGTKKIRLFVSAYGQTNANAGGVVMINVDYTDPDNVTYDGHQYWQYDVDREYPSHKTSAREDIDPPMEPDWQFRPAHSTELITIGSGSNTKKYVLAATESNSWYDRRTTSTLDFANGHYYGSDWAELYDGTNENDKLIGNYLRIWETDLTAGYTKIIGTGTNEGPISSYDPIEQAPASGAHYTSSALRNSQISITSSTAADDLTSSTAVGLSTVHRARSVPGSTDVFIASYSQGARVIDLKDMSVTNPEVKEKAFFDFIPTLNYAKNSEYFYLNAHQGSGGAFTTFFPDGKRAYFMGAEDIRADVERTGITGGLPSDEKFVYALAYGEGFMSGETLPRNWLNNSGFLILRYFDDKIGGTISGFVGSSDWNNRSHREVNLQGEFSVERNTLIATGATVRLLDGTRLNKKASYNNEFLDVEGTLSIETTAGTGRGEIHVPITVRAGGKLIVEAGKEIDFLSAVTVKPGGELTVKEGAKAIFASPSNTCDGKLSIVGTSTSRAKIFPKQNTGRTAHDGNAHITMKGDNSTTSTLLKIHFADVENVCIDAEDIWASNQMLLNSNFSSNTTSAKPFLVGYRKSKKFPLDIVIQLWTSLKVENCTFEDRFGVRANRAYKFSGLKFERVHYANITNNTFAYLHNGAQFMLGSRVTLKQNNVHDTKVGVLCSEIAPIICTNNFDANEYAYLGDKAKATNLYDNTFEDNYLGAVALTSAPHHVRGNTFDEYYKGIMATSTQLELAFTFTPRVTPHWNKLGRNTFVVSTSPLTNYFGRSSVSVYDIFLNESLLSIKCGFNSFNDKSLQHVFGDGNLAPFIFDPSFNEWKNPGGTFAVRSNLATAGAPLNTSATVSATCLRINEDPGCSTPPCESYVTIVEYADTVALDSTFHERFDSLNGRVIYPVNDLDCRLRYAHELMELAVLFDSAQFYLDLIDIYDSLYANTYDSSVIRSRALLLKAEVLERIDSTEDALDVYETIVTDFASSHDSIPAAWRIQHINAMKDVNKDSLLGVYNDRVYNDLNRITFTSEPAPKLAGEGEIHNIVDTKPVLEQNRPNPWNNETLIAFSLPHSGQARLSVIDVLGNEVAVLVDAEQKAGRTVIKFKEDLAEGIYFYRLQYGNEVITQKMTKSK